MRRCCRFDTDDPRRHVFETDPPHGKELVDMQLWIDQPELPGSGSAPCPCRWLGRHRDHQLQLALPAWCADDMKRWSRSPQAPPLDAPLETPILHIDYDVEHLIWCFGSVLDWQSRSSDWAIEKAGTADSMEAVIIGVVVADDRTAHTVRVEVADFDKHLTRIRELSNGVFTESTVDSRRIAVADDLEGRRLVLWERNGA